MNPSRGLSLAAAPAFAVMAVLTACLGGGPMDVLCSAGRGISLGGMVPMYLLMSAFHTPPWLELIFAHRRASGASWPRLRRRSSDQVPPTPSGTTAVTSISTLAPSSINAATCTAVIAA